MNPPIRTWSRRPLADLLEIRSGQIDPRKKAFGHMLHVGSDNIESHTGRLFGMKPAAEIGLISGKFPFDETMVLYSKIRPYLNKVATPSFSGICSADIYPLKPDSKVLDRGFLAHLLRQKEFLDYTEAFSARTSIPKINRKALAAYEAPVPPLEEQRRIAALLDKADAIRRKRQEAIALTEQLLRSTFLEMFGDPVTNPKHWPIQSLGELITVKSGSFLPAKNMDKDGEFLVYGGNGVNGRHSSYLFEEPQIVLGRVGVYCGVVHLTAPRSWITDNALYVASASPLLERQYLVWALRMCDLNQYANQAAQPLITGATVYKVPILIPPREAQLSFSRVCGRHIKVISHASDALAQAETLFHSLVQRAFNGQL